MVFNRLTVAFFLFLFLPLSVQAASPTAVTLPDLLKPWQDWVLYGHEEKLACTPSFTDSQNIQCDWPASLQLDITKQGAEFTQNWFVQRKRWLQLPGNMDTWPENISIDGQEAVVLNKGGMPRVLVPAGSHTLTGRFSWTAVPEFISIPAHTAIVHLVRFGQAVEFPNFDQQGRLWLKARQTQGEKTENRLTLKSFRLLDDRIPLQETISLQMEVSGAAREVLLGPVFSTGAAIPVSINSPLPARLEQDGRLKVQVRPGRWSMSVVTRHIDPVASLRFSAPQDGFWPNEEIWSFNARPNLRVVEIEGAPPIDPLQTSLPENWRRFPAYRVEDGETLRFNEIKRGDPHPAPDQLTLQRNLWLRFDGSGYTIQDTIIGSKTTGWRLEMRPPIQLGRVAVDGQEQFITRRDGTDNSGVELRNGLLNLTADSTYNGPVSGLPATGWDHDFHKVTARLALPPGWRLINASGIDSINNTWVKRWSLLDFFVVLIFTIAVARLYSYPLALLAFFALLLIYQEPNAPRWIWLAVLAGVALLRYLPAGKFKTAVKIYQLATILLLIGIAIPFSIQQLRVGIYPQLEKPWQSMIMDSRSRPAAQALQMPSGQIPAEQMMAEKPAGSVSPGRDANIHTEADKIQGVGRGYGSSATRQQVAQYDPAMINQTGLGLPDWRWNTFAMGWSGPVQRDQNISLLYTGPRTNLILSFLRVILLIVLILGLLEIRYRRDKGFIYPAVRFTALFFFLTAALLCSTPLRAGEIPPPQMLDQLQHRLLEPDQCFPGCADIASMEITINPDELRITMTAGATAEVYFPLPGNGMHWLPQKVRIDDRDAEALFRSGGTIMILLPEGKHRITMTGGIPRQNSLQLPLPLKPHRVKYSADGWTVEGIHENGVADNQIQFTRIVKEHQILTTGVLPPFLSIERTLRLGLTWKIETTVRRISPAGTAVVFAYPLLPGESILTENIRTKDNTVQVNLDANQGFLQWESTLEKSNKIFLKHAETTLWTETWQVDASPIYHLETSGIPVILHQQGNRWHPTWHPWPGEKVRLSVTRPVGVEGQTLTIEKTHLEIHTGRRTTETTLTLRARSSQGGQHTIVLPEAALLSEVMIDGHLQPIRQEKRRVPLPIKPGLQEFKLTWRNGTGITTRYTTPAIDLGIESVNANIDVFLPPNRWPLFMGGPLMGPAVLFWSVILILMLVAYGLGRTGLTPLRFHQWFLLGIGMSQSNIAAGLLVALWLIALHLRKKANPDMDKTTFNLMQIGLGFLTILALGALVSAISMGLLGHPDMNIVGNGSHSGLLRWYQDQSSSILPRAWVISIPMFVYRLAMLAWALWISFSLINLLKWGWHNFSQPVLWHKIPRKVRPKKGIKNDNGQPSGNMEKP